MTSINIVDLLMFMLTEPRRTAIRLVQQGAVYVNGLPVNEARVVTMADTTDGRVAVRIASRVEMVYLRAAFDPLGCLKGLCNRRATRIATYRSDAGLVQMRSCDYHGGGPAEDLEGAEAARKYNAELVLG